MIMLHWGKGLDVALAFNIRVRGYFKAKVLEFKVVLWVYGLGFRVRLGPG